MMLSDKEKRATKGFCINALYGYGSKLVAFSGILLGILLLIAMAAAGEN